jgi:hypothetical protein
VGGFIWTAKTLRSAIATVPAGYPPVTAKVKTVLVQLREDADPETGERYTVKNYESEITKQGDSWRHNKDQNYEWVTSPPNRYQKPE